MLEATQKIPATDPLVIPEKKELIDQILNANKDLPGATMVVLNEVQSQIGFISLPMQVYIAKSLGAPVSVVHGVVSFYSFFTTAPRGRHTIKFCLGTACYVGGTPQLIEKAKQEEPKEEIPLEFNVALQKYEPDLKKIKDKTLEEKEFVLTEEIEKEKLNYV